MTHINLTVELPDGKVQVTRTAPREVAVYPSTNPPEYLAWVIDELPDAVSQLFERSGLPDPLTPLYDALPVGVPHTLETLTAVVRDFDAARSALHGMASAMGIDLDTQRVDGRTGLLSKAHHLPRLAAEHATAVTELARAHDKRGHALSEIAGQLTTSVIHDSQLPSLLTLTLNDLRRDVDQRGEILDRVKEAAGLSATDDVADAELPTVVANLTRVEAADDLNKIMAALGFPKGFPGSAEALTKELHKREEDGARTAIANLLRVFDLPTDDDEPTDTLISLFNDLRRAAAQAEADRAELGRLRQHAVMVASRLAVGSPMAHDALTRGSFSAEDLVSFTDEVFREVSRAQAESDQAASVRAERDASRRILRDVARNLGSEDAGDTLLPSLASIKASLAGRTDDWARIANAVREVLDELTGEQAPDDAEELPEAVARAILLERYPIDTDVMVSTGGTSARATVHAITLDPENPIEVLDGHGTRRTVAPSDIAGYPDRLKGNPGEFITGDGVKAKAFKLPEGGLSEIFGRIHAPTLPNVEKFDDAVAELAGKVERFGDRMVEKVDNWFDKVIAEAEAAVEKAAAEKARKDGEQQ